MCKNISIKQLQADKQLNNTNSRLNTCFFCLPRVLKKKHKQYTIKTDFIVPPVYEEKPSAESRVGGGGQSESEGKRRDGGETQLTCCCCRCSSSTVLTSLLVSPALDLPSLLPASNWLLLRVLIPFWLIELLLIVSVADSCIIMI